MSKSKSDSEPMEIASDNSNSIQMNLIAFSNELMNHINTKVALNYEYFYYNDFINDFIDEVFLKQEEEEEATVDSASSSYTPTTSTPTSSSYLKFLTNSTPKKNSPLKPLYKDKHPLNKKTKKKKQMNLKQIINLYAQFEEKKKKSPNDLTYYQDLEHNVHDFINNLKNHNIEIYNELPSIFNKATYSINNKAKYSINNKAKYSLNNKYLINVFKNILKERELSLRGGDPQQLQIDKNLMQTYENENANTFELRNCQLDTYHDFKPSTRQKLFDNNKIIRILDNLILSDDILCKTSKEYIQKNHFERELISDMIKTPTDFDEIFQYPLRQPNRGIIQEENFNFLFTKEHPNVEHVKTTDSMYSQNVETLMDIYAHKNLDKIKYLFLEAAHNSYYKKIAEVLNLTFITSLSSIIDSKKTSSNLESDFLESILLNSSSSFPKLKMKLETVTLPQSFILPDNTQIYDIIYSSNNTSFYDDIYDVFQENANIKVRYRALIDKTNENIKGVMLFYNKSYDKPPFYTHILQNGGLSVEVLTQGLHWVEKTIKPISTTDSSSIQDKQLNEMYDIVSYLKKRTDITDDDIQLMILNHKLIGDGGQIRCVKLLNEKVVTDENRVALVTGDQTAGFASIIEDIPVLLNAFKGTTKPISETPSETITETKILKKIGKNVKKIYKNTKKFLKTKIPTNIIGTKESEREEIVEENIDEKITFIVFYLPSKYNDIELLVNSKNNSLINKVDILLNDLSIIYDNVENEEISNEISEIAKIAESAESAESANSANSANSASSASSAKRKRTSDSYETKENIINKLKEQLINLQSIRQKSEEEDFNVLNKKLSQIQRNIDEIEFKLKYQEFIDEGTVEVTEAFFTLTQRGRHFGRFRSKITQDIINDKGNQQDLLADVSTVIKYIFNIKKWPLDNHDLQQIYHNVMNNIRENLQNMLLVDDPNKMIAFLNKHSYELLFKQVLNAQKLREKDEKKESDINEKERKIQEEKKELDDWMNEKINEIDEIGNDRQSLIDKSSIDKIKSSLDKIKSSLKGNLNPTKLTNLRDKFNKALNKIKGKITKKIKEGGKTIKKRKRISKVKNKNKKTKRRTKTKTKNISKRSKKKYKTRKKHKRTRKKKQYKD